MVCTFYYPEKSACVNAYCYYELFNEPSCKIKAEFMAKTGPVDPTYRARVADAARREYEKELAKAVIWGKK